jgi:hypothetical protein
MKRSDANLAWVIFRKDVRRHWPARRLPLLLALLAAVLLLQFAVTLAVWRWAPFLTSEYFWIHSAVWAFNFHSSFAEPWAARAPAPSAADLLALMGLLLAAPDAAWRFLMPAHAALSIAPDREDRQLHELLLAGVPPGVILLSKGAASLLPYLAILVAAVVGVAGLTLGMWLQGRPLTVPANAFRPVWFPGSDLPVHLGWIVALQTLRIVLGWLLLGATLVCVSALCRRRNTALAACYCVSFLALPVVLLGAPYLYLYVLRLAGVTTASVGGWLTVGIQCLALAVLIPLALRALRFPDDRPVPHVKVPLPQVAWYTDTIEGATEPLDGEPDAQETNRVQG